MTVVASRSNGVSVAIVVSHLSREGETMGSAGKHLGVDIFMAFGDRREEIPGLGKGIVVHQVLGDCLT